MGTFRDRYPVVPWIYPLSDLRPQGNPEVEVFTAGSVLLGLRVIGVDTDALLGIRWADGGPVSALIAEQGLMVRTDDRR